MPRRRIHVALSVKDEAPYLLEWVAHYRALGATEITVFYNDCSDGTARMLARLEQMGMIGVAANPADPDRPKLSPQRRALDRLQAAPEVREADWFMFVDVDEFLNVHVGDRDFDALFDAVGEETDAISLNWRLFGSGGCLAFEDRPVTERFHRVDSATGGLRDPSVKTLFRPSRFLRFSLHRPVARGEDAYAERPLRWVNGSGDPIRATDIGVGGYLDRERVGFGLAQINHYAVRSREEFVRLRVRGSGWNNRGRFGWHYWWQREVDGDEDRSLDTSRMKPVLEELHSDPQLAELHRSAVRIHRERVATARAKPEIAHFLSGGDPPGGPATKPVETPSASSFERPVLSFPPHVGAFVRESYAAADTILEYGTGGSTVIASEMPDKAIFAVESDKEWADRIRGYIETSKATRSEPHIHHADIGPTGRWGAPKDNRASPQFCGYPIDVWDLAQFRHPDVVLIDGRFRIACFYTVMLRATRPTTVLFDDYLVREHYHVVEKFCRPRRYVGRLAVFEVSPTDFPRDELKTVVSAFARPG